MIRSVGQQFTDYSKHRPDTILNMALNIDDLLQTPPADLINALKALRDERGDLESKESLLMQIIDIRSNQGGEVAKEINELGAAIGLGSLRDQIKQVLLSRQAEEPLMFPKDVRMELVSWGNRSVTLENVRVTMQRMAVGRDAQTTPTNPSSSATTGSAASGSSSTTPTTPAVLPMPHVTRLQLRSAAGYTAEAVLRRGDFVHARAEQNGSVTLGYSCSVNHETAAGGAASS